MNHHRSRYSWENGWFRYTDNRRFSLSQMSRTELARVMPWRENVPWNGRFSLSQMSRTELARVMPWRENVPWNGRFSLSQMGRANLAWAMPWREKEPWNGTFYAFDGRSMEKNSIFGDPLKTAKWIIRPKVVTLFLSVVFKAYFQYGENLSAWKCQAGSKEKIKWTPLDS